MRVFNNNVSVCYYLIVDMSRLATLSPYNINRERDKFLLGLFHFICDTSEGSEIVMMRMDEIWCPREFGDSFQHSCFLRLPYKIYLSAPKNIYFLYEE